MGLKRFRWLLLLLLVIFHIHILTEVAEARLISSAKQGGYVKELQFLGLMCRCCDGLDCRSTWRGSTCAKLECEPWKFF